MSVFSFRALFPYVLHPGKAISLTASIYMVVAIACDRFQAICNPSLYRVSLSFQIQDTDRKKHYKGLNFQLFIAEC